MKNLIRYILPAAITTMLVASLSCPETARGRIKPIAVPQTQTGQTAAPDSPLKAGRDRYLKTCAACHGDRAEGYAGPNLTDKYWIHGGGLKNVAATITDGNPAKGMIAWNAVFSAKEIQEIAAYVLSLQGTNPPKAKKPEGTLHEENRH